MTMIQLRQTVTYSLSIQAMIKRKNGRSSVPPEDDLVGGLIADSGRSGYPFTGRYPDRLS